MRVSRWTFVFVLSFLYAILTPLSIAQVAEDPAPDNTAADVVKPTPPVQDPQDVASLVDNMVHGSRGVFGFSLGVFHTYTADLVASSSRRDSLFLTSLQPQLIAYLPGRTFRARFRYAFEGMRSSGSQHSDSYNHAGSVQLERALSRYSSLQIEDQFLSAFNAGVLQTATFIPLVYQTGFAPDINATPQRVTSNSLGVAITSRLGKRGSVSVTGGHQSLRYQTQALGASSGAQVAVAGRYQIKKWLVLNFGYSSYLNTIDERARTATTQRLQFPGLTLKVRRGLELSAGGEWEYNHQMGANASRFSFEGGLSKKQGGITWAILYHTGFATAVGLRTTLDGDTIVGSVNRQLHRRIFLRGDTTYVRGASAFQSSRVKAISATGTLEMAIQKHVLLSTRYWYIDQRANGLASGAVTLNRYAASVGIQYFLPSVVQR